MPGELGWMAALGCIVIGYCMLTISSPRFPFLKRRREAIDTGFRVALLLIMAAYLLLSVLPGLSQIGGW